jgi:hypothetical protein
VAYLHNTVFGQKYLHYHCGIARGIVVQQEPTALCSKLWPHPRNALQQSSDNLNIGRTFDSLPFRHKFFMNHPVCQKMSSAWFWSWTSANETFWALVMTLRSVACSDVSSLGHIEYPWLIPSYSAMKKTVIVLTSLDEVSARCESPLLLLIRETAWDELAQILLFRKSSWRIWRIVSLLMFSSSDLILRAHRRPRHHFTDIMINSMCVRMSMDYL